MDKDLIISFPVYRDITTINASPMLASQAPNLKKMIDVMVNDIVFIERISGIYKTNLSVIPSSASRDIRR